MKSFSKTKKRDSLQKLGWVSCFVNVICTNDRLKLIVTQQVKMSTLSLLFQSYTLKSRIYLLNKLFKELIEFRMIFFYTCGEENMI